MGSYFSLVQLYSDNLADDHLTVGIVAVNDDDSAASVRFVADWQRATRFTGRPIKHLRKLAEELTAESGSNSPLAPSTLTKRRLEDYAGSYRNIIRFTNPEFVDESAEVWVRDFAQLFVKDLEKRKARRPRYTQPELAHASRDFLEIVLARDFDIHSARRVVREEKFESKFKNPRTIDAAAMNGRIHFGFVAVRLDVESEDAQKHVDGAFTLLYDLKELLGDTPIVIVTDPVVNPVFDGGSRLQSQLQLQSRADMLKSKVIPITDQEALRHQVINAMTPEVVAALSTD